MWIREIGGNAKLVETPKKNPVETRNWWKREKKLVETRNWSQSTWSSSMSDEDGKAPSKHPNASSSGGGASGALEVIAAEGAAVVGDMALDAAASWSDSSRISPSASSRRDCEGMGAIRVRESLSHRVGRA